MKLFKPKTISDSSLVCCLEDLRHALKSINKSDMDKINFFNLESFLTYVQEFGQVYDSNGKNVEELLNLIEPYIPLVITDKNIEAFLGAAISNDEKSLNTLENVFIENSKIKFINNIININSHTQWQDLVNICRTIRTYKNEEANAKML